MALSLRSLTDSASLSATRRRSCRVGYPSSIDGAQTRARADHSARAALLGVALAILPSKGLRADDRCPESATIVTTTPAPRQRWQQAETSMASIAALPKGKVDLLLIGDSFVARWPTQLLNQFGKVAKFGVSGDRTQNVLWRLTRSVAADIRPSRVVILIGTNNLAAGDKPCAIAVGVSAIVRSANSLWPSAEIELLGIPPRSDRSDDPSRSDTNQRLAQLLSVNFTSIDHALSCRADQCDLYNPDHIHLTLEGYGKIVELLRQK